MKYCSKWFLLFIGLIFFAGLQTNALAEVSTNGTLKVIVSSFAIELTPTTTSTTAPIATTTTTAPTATTTTTAAETSTTTTTTSAGPCPAEAVLGEDDPRLDTLRAFRDQVLAKNPNGQKMIKMYYDSSAAVVQMLENDPALKESARKYLESILPTIERITKQKASQK